MPTKKLPSFEGVHQFLRTLFVDDLHARRVPSLAGATLGLIESASGCGTPAAPSRARAPGMSRGGTGWAGSQ